MLLHFCRPRPHLRRSSLISSHIKSIQSTRIPRWPSPCRHFQILAIETSCDDTCVAVLELLPSESNLRKPNLIFNRRITSDNVRYGGVHPLRAMESHHANLAPLVAEALASPEVRQPDLIAVTHGPGMRINLQCGIDVAKGLSLAWNVPLIGIHHMQAHALVPRLANALADFKDEATTSMPQVHARPRFPFLSLLISGGHTLLVQSKSVTEQRILASTVDIAIGDCLDKIARAVIPPDLLKSSESVSYGKLLESFAFGTDPVNENQDIINYKYTPPKTMGQDLRKGQEKNEYGWHFPAPLLTRDGRKFKTMQFSFAGITAHAERVVKYGASHGTPRESPMSVNEARHLAKAAMESAFEHLASRVCLFLKSQAEFKKSESETINQTETSMKSLVLGGGVASNNYLKHILRSYLKVRGFGHLELEFSPPALCVDNAAMIAWTAAEMTGAATAGPESELKTEELRSSLSMRAIRRWSLENLMAPEKELERELEEEKERDERRQQKASAPEMSGPQIPTSSEALGRLLANFQARPESIPIRSSATPEDISNAAQIAPDSASVTPASSSRETPRAISHLTRKQAVAKIFGTEMQGEGVLQVDPAQGFGAQLKRAAGACTLFDELKDLYWKTVRWVNEQLTQDRLRTSSERKQFAGQRSPRSISSLANRYGASRLKTGRLYIAEHIFLLRFGQLRPSMPIVYPVEPHKPSAKSLMSNTPIVTSIQLRQPIPAKVSRARMRAEPLRRPRPRAPGKVTAIAATRHLPRSHITLARKIEWLEPTEDVEWAPDSEVSDKQDELVLVERPSTGHTSKVPIAAPRHSPRSHITLGHKMEWLEPTENVDWAPESEIGDSEPVLVERPSTEHTGKLAVQSSSTIAGLKRASEQSELKDESMSPHQLEKLGRLKDSKGWDLGPLGSEI